MPALLLGLHRVWQPIALPSKMPQTVLRRMEGRESASVFSTETTQASSIQSTIHHALCYVCYNRLFVFLPKYYCTGCTAKFRSDLVVNLSLGYLDIWIALTQTAACFHLRIFKNSSSWFTRRCVAAYHPAWAKDHVPSASMRSPLRLVLLLLVLRIGTDVSSNL